MQNSPSVIIIAGPNGAGKSTLAPQLLKGRLSVSTFVNADVIAQGLAAYDPESAAISAGRVMLERLNELAESRESFAFETTLSSRSFARWLPKLIADGYRFHLTYVWLPSPTLSVARIQDRVRQGGHFFPDAVVIRRYERSLSNFFKLYQPLARTWRMYDNSNEKPYRLVAAGQRDQARLVKRPELWNHLEATYAKT